MGLDSVEFVMAVEAAFGLDIADRDAERMATPRDVIAHLRDRVPRAEWAPCLTQRAFYRTRASCARRFGLAPRALGPDTPLAEVLPPDGRAREWRAVGAELGAEQWPALAADRWLPFGPRTLRDVAARLAERSPAAVKGGDGWTDAEVERTVVRLVEVEFGVDMRAFTLDAEFIRDLGAD